MKSQDKTVTHEEHLILKEGFEDVVHNFIDESAFTMPKTPQFPAWRPDKIVMEKIAPEAQTRPTWKCISTTIVGDEARPFYADKGE